jgi:hypothetical protein
MEYIIRLTPFIVPVFITTKEYPVINLYIINKLIVSNTYPIPL